MMACRVSYGDVLTAHIQRIFKATKRSVEGVDRLVVPAHLWPIAQVAIRGLGEHRGGRQRPLDGCDVGGLKLRGRGVLGLCQCPFCDQPNILIRDPGMFTGGL